MLEPAIRSDEPRRQDIPSLWLLAVILIIVGLSIYSAAVGTGSIRHAGVKQIKFSDSDLDDQSVQDLIGIDMYTKAAFITSVLDGKPNRDYLKLAFTSAESMVDDTHNAPFAARRLILLRALRGLPPLVKTSHGNLPLDAFVVSLPVSYSASDRADYVREAAIWRSAFTPSKLTNAQAKQIAAEIKRQPNLKWWRQPALYAVYERAGDINSARDAAATAANTCGASVAVAGVMALLKLATILVGIVLLIALAVIAFAKWQAVPILPTGWPSSEPNAYAAPVGPVLAQSPSGASNVDLWKIEPEPIAMTDRQLSSTDLFVVFLLYMVLSSALGVFISGFPGFGHRHLLKFAGLITPYLHKISLMPSSTRMIVLVALEALAYVVSGGVPILWLIYLARKRGASLSKELGLTRHFSPSSVLYGAGGFCIGMPLMLLVGLVAPRVFRHFPSPENPAIPQLISANSLTAGLILICLASFAAPIVEETLFRGVLYNAIKMRVGVWPAIILSGFVFGFIHPVGIAEMFPLAVLGGVFAWMAETRKSLAPSMVAHCINNLTTCLLIFALMQQ